MQIDSPNILTQLNVSGSASITGSLNVSGTITASDIQGTVTTASFIEYNNVANKPALVSGSSQITLSDTDGFTEYSGSVGTLINNLETASGSIRTDFNSYTSSADGRIGSLETESGSIRTDFNSYTGSTDSRVGSLETYSSSLKTAFSLDGANVTVLGNLEVAGTTTTIDSTTVDIGTNIIDLNGTGAVLAGLRVNDVTAPNQVSGSLLWNSTTDRWIAGPSGSESNILLANGDGVVSGSSQIDLNTATGTLNVNKGGTGQTSYTNGQLLIGNTTGNTLTKATLTQGTGITITNGAGTIEVINSSPHIATNLSWTAGTTAGPQVNSSTGDDAVIPSASGTASGIITTTTQTFAGNKTFNNDLHSSGSLSSFRFILPVGTDLFAT